MANTTNPVQAASRAVPACGPVPSLPRCPIHPDDGPLVAAGDRLACATCGRGYARRNGVLDLLPPGGDYPAEFREREAAQWDEQADRYDEGRTRDAVYMAGVEAAAEALAPRPGEVVLDAGCGTGLALRRAWRPGVRAAALDLSAESLRRCRAALPEADALYARGDLARLPFATDTFDRVLCANAIQQLPGQALRGRCVRELGRVTRPGGRVVVTVQNFSRSKRRAGWRKESHAARGPSGGVQYVYRYETDELRDQLAAAGLEVERVCGAGLPLPYRLKLSPVSRALERVFRRVEASAGFGHMLVAVCRAPAPA